MSAFLGPIHFWLYNKIKLQDDLVEDILVLADKLGIELREELDQRFGKLPQESLENIIDESNIHGWLQTKVGVVERRLAYTVTKLLSLEASYLDEIKSIAYEFGKNKIEGKKDTPKDVFQLLNNTLLDGMPCDHANALISESDQKVTWKRNVCVHGDYWEEVEGDISVYYALRDEIIKGLVDGSGSEYHILEDNEYLLEQTK